MIGVAPASTAVEPLSGLTRRISGRDSTPHDAPLAASAVHHTQMVKRMA
jgi:hypothetical protein